MRERRRRVLPEQRNQVGLHAGAEHLAQRSGYVQAGLPSLQAVEQGTATGQLGGRQALGQLFAQHLSHRPAAAGQGDHRAGAGLLGSQAGDQRAFAVADQNQWAETRVGLELAAPGHHIGDIALDAEVTFVGRRRLAGGHATFVEAHAGNVVAGQQQGQPLEVVDTPRGRVVAVAVRRAGTSDDQHHGGRGGLLRQQQAAVQHALAGVQVDGALQDGGGGGLGEAGTEHEKQGDEARHHGVLRWGGDEYDLMFA
ncbi:hypothetical protein D3C76_1127280 [compost metagenome]